MNPEDFLVVLRLKRLTPPKKAQRQDAAVEAARAIPAGDGAGPGQFVYRAGDGDAVRYVYSMQGPTQRAGP
jgi:hypothetical protein